MYRISREFSFCYGHRLLNYDGKCAHLHGHNARVVMTLAADALDTSGMVRDFAELKHTLGQWIEETLDHKMLLAQDDPMVPVLQAQGEPCCVLGENPTAEHLARLIFQYAQTRGYPVRSVRFWETPNCMAEYAEAD